MLTATTLDHARADIRAAAALAARDRQAGIRQLNALFRQGQPPTPALDGRYKGTLVAFSYNPVLDALGRAITRRWLPWQGKTFGAKTQTGDNLFTNDGLPLARLFFPFYHRYVDDGPGRSRALQFRTYYGPGAHDPDRTVLKIDYDLDVNPRFVVRQVLDELVQVAPGYYLGKALLRWGKAWRCAAYFTLEALSGP
jgi:hypothetical protein